VKGAGGLCGAIFLDEEFSRKLRSWINKDKLRLLTPQRKRKLLTDDWERVLKRDFTSNEDRDWPISIPQDWQERNAPKAKASRNFIKNAFKSKPQDPIPTQEVSMKLST
jgi:hypothetical protein